MISGRIFKIVITAVFSIMLFLPFGMCVSEGRKAPDFEVVSGNDEILTLDTIKGMVAVIFYETKDTKEKNRPLKKDLEAFYMLQAPAVKKDIARIAIIRCSNFFPNVWRKNLRDNSKKEGIVIYGDWDGSMENSYEMKKGESNFLIIDKEGIIRYADSGVIPKEDFPKIRAVLDSIK